MSHLVGKPAPAITGVKDQNGNDFSSESVIGGVPVVLFFYPQAMTMGCRPTINSVNHVAQPIQTAISVLQVLRKLALCATLITDRLSREIVSPLSCGSCQYLQYLDVEEPKADCKDVV